MAGTQIETFARILALIRAGEAEGTDLLLTTFHRGLLLLAGCESVAMTDHVEDSVATLMVEYVRANGRINPPELPGILCKLMKQQAAWLRANDMLSPDCRAGASPPLVAAIKSGLLRLDACERDILERLYVKQQSVSQIVQEMHLSDSLFLQYKNHARRIYAFDSMRAQETVA